MGVASRTIDETSSTVNSFLIVRCNRMLQQHMGGSTLDIHRYLHGTYSSCHFLFYVLVDVRFSVQSAEI